MPASWMSLGEDVSGGEGLGERGLRRGERERAVGGREEGKGASLPPTSTAPLALVLATGSRSSGS